jgi:UDP-glucose 4-epimerase
VSKLQPRVLVTGGAGFIGGAVARAYLELGARTLVVDDFSSGSPERVPSGAAVEPVDIRSDAFSRAALTFRPTLVVHAAAQISVPRSLSDPELDRSINVGGTRRVVEAARSTGARVVFLSSGGAIYGDTNGATEESPPRPTSPYGRHKLEAEAIVRGSGVPYAIARLANVYGPGQRAGGEGGVVAVLASQLEAGEPVTIHGDGCQTRDFIHLDDVISALLLLGALEQSGTWNIGTETEASILELLDHLCRLLGPSVGITYLPPRPGDVRRSRLIIGRIRRLGWQPRISLPEGLGFLALGRPTPRLSAPRG